MTTRTAEDCKYRFGQLGDVAWVVRITVEKFTRLIDTAASRRSFDALLDEALEPTEDREVEAVA